MTDFDQTLKNAINAVSDSISYGYPLPAGQADRYRKAIDRLVEEHNIARPSLFWHRATAVKTLLNVYSDTEHPMEN